MLKPQSFKTVLVDIHTREIRIKYIKYYFFLENCIIYFNNYLNLKNELIINQQKEMLAGQDDRIDYLIKQNNEQTQKIDQLLNYGKDTKDKLDDIQEHNELLLEQNEVVIQQNEIISDKLNIYKHDRVSRLL